MRALFLLLLLGACAAAAPDTPRAACERASGDDPAVRDLLMKGAGSESFQAEHQADLRDARRRAVLACLRARGLVRAGGVEAPKPP